VKQCRISPAAGLDYRSSDVATRTQKYGQEPTHWLSNHPNLHKISLKKCAFFTAFQHFYYLCGEF
jgi:hypothetical protein